MSTRILDSFTDTNGTALASHAIAPTNLPGASWSVLAGSFNIQSNRANSANTTTGYAVFDSGVADCTISCVINGAATPIGIYVLFRVTDASNFWFAYVAPGGNWILFKKVAGSNTNVASGTAPGTGDHTVNVTLSGNSISINWDGTNTLSTTDSFNATATKHGIGYDTATGQRWDDFTVSATTAAVRPWWQYTQPMMVNSGGGF